jgi:hypothetical protein
MLHMFLPVRILVYMSFQNVDYQFINDLLTANETAVLGSETIDTQEETTKNNLISQT